MQSVDALAGMALESGTSLGHYEVIAKIGEGGMGEVYRARDTTLDRDVALKVVPEAFTSDPARLARFEREAKILASLNHPNIAAIHGFEEAGGIKALVLELVEGPTLAERIAQGPIAVDEAIAIASQIAEALEAAHEAGVVHRDLKPANVKVREDGTVKVLDFGLAKALDATPEGDPSQSPTMTAAATQIGVILGTAAYMAPEQARGRAVDKRADIWAFGAVLFEMLTGTQPFPGEDVSHTLARVIERDPDWDALPDDLPPAVDAYLRRCLQKSPRDRVRDIGDVRLALSGAFDSSSAPTAAASGSESPALWRRALPWVAALALALGAAGLARWWMPASPSPRVVRFGAVEAPPGAAATPAFNAALSPDGGYLVYRDGRGLVARHLDQRTTVPFPDTGAAYGPFVSADSADVGFFVGHRGAQLSTGIYRAPVAGGSARLLGTVSGGAIGASWGSDDTIVVGTGPPSGLWRLSADGGEVEPLTEVDEPGVNHQWPHFLPGAEALLFTITDEAGAHQVAVLDMETGEQTVLLPSGTSARYLSTGHLLYTANDALEVVEFDLDRREVRGDPFVVLADVATMASGAGPYGVADDGTLFYLPRGVEQRPDQYQLSWVDQDGNLDRIPVAPGQLRTYALSPDGTRAVIAIGEEEDVDLWLADLATGLVTRLTFEPGREWAPLWTPDGERVVYRFGNSLFWKAVDGTGAPERLGPGGTPLSWADEGRTLVVGGRTLEARGDISLLSLADGTERPLLDGPARESQAAVSPDGRWLAYLSEEGDTRLLVRPFPNIADGLWQVDTAGLSPRWAADGSEVYYIQLSNGVPTMTRVPVTLEPTFSQGTPEPLFDASVFFFDSEILSTTAVVRLFDLAPDGRFLVSTRVGAASEPQELVLVLNWFEELRRLAPDS